MIDRVQLMIAEISTMVSTAKPKGQGEEIDLEEIIRFAASNSLRILATGLFIFGMLYLVNMYRRERVRREQWSNTLEACLTSSQVGYKHEDELLGNIGPLTRVYERENEPGYQTKEGLPLELTPLKTIPLNYHWSWGGDTLRIGLTSHIASEGTKIGADAYYLSYMVSGHRNPMYALAFFRTADKNLRN